MKWFLKMNDEYAEGQRVSHKVVSEIIEVLRRNQSTVDVQFSYDHMTIGLRESLIKSGHIDEDCTVIIREPIHNA